MQNIFLAYIIRMKLNNMHIIIILVSTLIFSILLGPNVIEGFDTSTTTTATPTTTTTTAAPTTTTTTAAPTTTTSAPSVPLFQNPLTDWSGKGQWPGQGQGSSQGQWPGSGSGQGQGQWPGSGSSQGQWPGSGSGQGQGSSQGQGSGQGQWSSQGQGQRPPQYTTQAPQPATTEMPNASRISATPYHSLSSGIYAHQIPAGDADKYILKSEIVPPVCPACPSINSCPVPQESPPCPPCGRCPKSNFECKKIPIYNSSNDTLPGALPSQSNVSQSPMPILNDFSAFSK